MTLVVLLLAALHHLAEEAEETRARKAEAPEGVVVRLTGLETENSRIEFER